MSLWSRLADALAALRDGESLAEVFGRARKPPEMRVAFAIAVIALGAKMAKADGRVTRDEVAAFREVFHIGPRDEANAARVFNLARQDVTGYRDYARRIRTMFRGDSRVLTDLLDGLFHVATADGAYHPDEDAFLRDVAADFGLTGACFDRLRAVWVPGAPRDPYAVLGVTPDMATDAIRRVWRQTVRDTHPDRMIARGVPEEAVKLAEARLIAANRAWEAISAERAA
jgi:DnaJ like chaperone protein